MPDLQPKPTREERILRAVETLARDFAGVRLELEWVEGIDRKTCRNAALMLDRAGEIKKAQVAVVLPRESSRAVGIAIPKASPGFSVVVMRVRVLAPSDAYLRLPDGEPCSSVRLDLTAADAPVKEGELRIGVGRGTFGCRVIGVEDVKPP
jgi:hypothetical protein